MRIGLVGLPNSGKTTVFNALTRGDAATASYSGGSLDINASVVGVPDPRIDTLVDLYQPKKVTYAKVEYSDIGGLRDNAKRITISGEQLGQIATNHALVHVVRAFEDDNIPHPLDSLDPQRDIALLDTEFLLSDLSKVENRLPKLEANLQKGKVLPTYQAEKREYETLLRVREGLEADTPIRDLILSAGEQKCIRGFQFLTEKPIMILINLGDEADPEQICIEYPYQNSMISYIRGRLEMDIVRLDEGDAQLFMAEYAIEKLSLNRIIAESYQLLNRMTFFTAGEREVRAWEAPLNATAVDCAGVIHSDLGRGFIRAEAVSFTDLVEAGSETAAKTAGTYRLEGRDYIVRDGDVLLIRFNV